MFRRIALTGKAGSGKSTAAKWLVTKHEFVRLSFATPLRVVVRDLFGIDTFNMKMPVGRDLLQRVGVALREVDADVWVRQMEVKLNALPVDANVVIDDMRFPNEAEWARRNGFEIVRLERPDVEYLSGEAAKHVSESFEIETKHTIIATDIQTLVEYIEEYYRSGVISVANRVAPHRYHEPIPAFLGKSA